MQVDSVPKPPKSKGLAIIGVKITSIIQHFTMKIAEIGTSKLDDAPRLPTREQKRAGGKTNFETVVKNEQLVATLKISEKRAR